MKLIGAGASLMWSRVGFPGPPRPLKPSSPQARDWIGLVWSGLAQAVQSGPAQSSPVQSY
eukprot:5840159-Lingulodinium_polyedra.AAC.1